MSMPSHKLYAALRFLGLNIMTPVILLCLSSEDTSIKIGPIQRRLAWPLRKDDTHNLRWIWCLHQAIFLQNQERDVSQTVGICFGKTNKMPMRQKFAY